jgi:hypothetical protein
VPSLMLAAGCSLISARTEMPLPPAALATECPALQTPPDPLVDPERLQWEADSVMRYEACRARHRETVRAWRDAITATQR